MVLWLVVRVGTIAMAPGARPRAVIAPVHRRDRIGHCHRSRDHRQIAAPDRRRPGCRRSRQAAGAGAVGRAAAQRGADDRTGCRTRFLRLVPEGMAFCNEAAARVGLRITLDNPGRSARKVQCPILFCICDTDSVASAGATGTVRPKAPRGEIKHYPFDTSTSNVGGGFERACVISRLPRKARAGWPDLTARYGAAPAVA